MKYGEKGRKWEQNSSCNWAGNVYLEFWPQGNNNKRNESKHLKWHYFGCGQTGTVTCISTCLDPWLGPISSGGLSRRTRIANTNGILICSLCLNVCFLQACRRVWVQSVWIYFP